MPCTEAFVKACQQTPMADLIRNLQTRVERLEIAGQSFPMTVNDGDQPKNCYICNPIVGYADYAVEETRHFVTNPLLQKSLIGLIRAAGPMLRATRLDRAVHVNNWLFSTNPAPKIDRPCAATMRDTLVSRFPTHAIVLRSLNTYADGMALDALKEEGFVLLPSRQIYLFDGAMAPSPSHDMKTDKHLLQKTPLVRGIPETLEDYARCAELYGMLYLQKYTPLNPQYTADFLTQMQRTGVLQLETLREPGGEILALGGRFQYGRTVTQPLVGYDTTRPQKEGLYRLIMTMAQQEAMTHRLLLNMSAGAAGFKRLRRAVPAIEYSAVYARHLPISQRGAIRALASLLTRVGVPLLQRYEL